MHATVFLGIFGSEGLIIIFVILVLFGGDKLPEIMRAIGKGVGEIRKATDSIKEEINNVDPTKDLKKDE